MLLTKEIYQNCKFHMHDPLHVELEMKGLKKPHSLSHLDPVAVYLCCHARRLFCYLLGCLIIGSVACDKTRNSRSATFWFNGIVSLVWQLRFGFLDGLKLICPRIFKYLPGFFMSAAANVLRMFIEIIETRGLASLHRIHTIDVYADESLK